MVGTISVKVKWATWDHYNQVILLEDPSLNVLTSRDSSEVERALHGAVRLNYSNKVRTELILF